MLIVLIAWFCISIVGIVAFLCAAARPLAREPGQERKLETTLELKPRAARETRGSKPALGTLTSSISS
jgi:hypothetical protein